MPNSNERMQDREAIKEVVAKWMAASKTGDSETVLGLMTDDAVFMTVGNEPFGKEAFEAAARAQSGMKIEGTAEVREIEVFGEVAFARTYITISMQKDGEAVIKKSGYTLTLFRKGADGAWRLYRDANLLQ